MVRGYVCTCRGTGRCLRYLVAHQLTDSAMTKASTLHNSQMTSNCVEYMAPHSRYLELTVKSRALTTVMLITREGPCELG